MSDYRELPPLLSLNGKFNAYCGVCWHPTYALWVADESPDYTRCPLGDYTAQNCPNSVADAELTAFLATVDPKDGTAEQSVPAREESKSPLAQSETSS